MNDSLLNQIVGQNNKMSEKIGALTGKVETAITDSAAIRRECGQNKSDIQGLQQQQEVQRKTISTHSGKFEKLDDIKVRVAVRVVLIVLGTGTTGAGLMYLAKFLELLK